MTSRLRTSTILQTWWPLAASWLLMGAELPFLSAIVARLDNPEINLAAYGGIVFPIALIIESPIIMLLSASTALSKDWDSYKKIRRFMFTAGGILTIIHIIIAFSPIYYFISRTLIGAPEEIIESGRIGLIIMTPWTLSIAYRRFQQGVLIRFEKSRIVGIGTVVRLIFDAIFLFAGLLINTYAGIIVATTAVAAGVISEAVYVGIRVKPIVETNLKYSPAKHPKLTSKAFADYYIPLALTSLLTLLIQPIGSAALSRMPNALASLAVWPVVSGLLFMFRSPGVAYNEVVVALLEKPKSSQRLKTFANYLAVSLLILLILVTISPLAHIWFNKVSALSLDLTNIAIIGLMIAIPMPSVNVFISWFQGIILNSNNTNAIPESVLISLLVIGILLITGIQIETFTGLYVGIFAFLVGMVAQASWLWYRSRKHFTTISLRDR